jgi:hypothetical protein
MGHVDEGRARRSLWVHLRAFLWDFEGSIGELPGLRHVRVLIRLSAKCSRERDYCHRVRDFRFASDASFREDHPHPHPPPHPHPHPQFLFLFLLLVPLPAISRRIDFPCQHLTIPHRLRNSPSAPDPPNSPEVSVFPVVLSHPCGSSLTGLSLFLARAGNAPDRTGNPRPRIGFWSSKGRL